MANEEKTISYLNSKAWYRLIKVIYILVFITALISFNLFLYSINGLKTVDQDKTQIQCNIGDRKTFTSKSINLNLDKSDFKNDKFDYEQFFRNYNDFEIKNILKECSPESAKNLIDSLDVFRIQRIYEITGIKGAEKEYDKDYLNSETQKITSGYKTSDEKANYLDFSVKFFDIKPVFTYNEFIKYFLIGNLIMLLIFEGIKRIFYYIVLGSIKPKQ